jgi:hypothetical protein
MIDLSWLLKNFFFLSSSGKFADGKPIRLQVIASKQATGSKRRFIR